jgi:hypothetical protein
MTFGTLMKYLLAIIFFIILGLALYLVLKRTGLSQ